MKPKETVFVFFFSLDQVVANPRQGVSCGYDILVVKRNGLKPVFYLSLVKTTVTNRSFIALHLLFFKAYFTQVGLFCFYYPDWKKQQQSNAWLSGRLASLGIMEGPPEIPRTITALSYMEGFKSGPELGPRYPEKHQSLSQLMYFFSYGATQEHGLAECCCLKYR